jgi:hypothetical protein
MWIFTQRAFLSIVRHSEKPGVLIVRSRFPNHIQTIFPDAHVEEDGTRDYRFRAELPVREVAKTISRMVLEIDYPNFKDSFDLDDEKYFETCIDVYNVVARNSGDWDLDNFIFGRRESNEG